MMSNNQTEWITNFHKALSNNERLRIIDLLLESELCQCDVFPEIGLAQSTVSSYLTQLVRAGILKVKRDGVRKIYSISSPEILQVIQTIRKVAKKKVKSK